MKKILSLAMVLAMLCSMLVLPAAAVGETFECVAVKTVNGAVVDDLTTLNVGDTVVVTVNLTRTDIADGATYEAWGLEMIINSLGMTDVSSVGYTYNGTATSPSTKAVGGATGTVNLSFMHHTGGPETTFTLAKTVTVTATYTVNDPAKAQAWAPNPYIYLAGSYDRLEVTNNCTITLDPGAGALPAGASATIATRVGETVTLPTPTRSGYTFIGWSDGTGTFTGNYTVAGGKTLTAQWRSADFVVSFNANGGAVSPASKNIVQGQPYGALPTPAYIGHLFAGWFTAAEGGTQITESSVVNLTENQTLFAHWTECAHDGAKSYGSGTVSYSHIAGTHTHNVVTTRDVTCAVCGKKLDGETTTTTAACTGVDEHDPDHWFASSTQHYHQCAICGAYDYGNHTYNTNGYCKVCNYYNAAYNTSGSGGGGGGGGGAPTIIRDEDVPLADVDSIIVTTLVDPTTGASVSGERDENGHVVVTVRDANGNVLNSVPGGVRVSFTIREGEVAILLDKDGNEIDLLEKSIVEGQTAYVLVDGSCTIDIKYNAKPFDDVMPYDWFNSAVVFASSHELFQGVAEGVFAPNMPMTRGMLVTVLWRLENKPEDFATNQFPDVVDGTWYTEAVGWAAKNGLVKGYDNGTFMPDRNISRQEMAAILYRYMNYLGYDMSAQGDLSAFADGESVSAWALPSVRWANGAGIITGKDGNRIDPLGNATRAEVATMFMRIVTEMVM